MWKKAKKESKHSNGLGRSSSKSPKETIGEGTKHQSPYVGQQDQINTHKEKSKEEMTLTIINIQVEQERPVSQAFFDSGADCNTIYYELFQQLGGNEL